MNIALTSDRAIQDNYFPLRKACYKLLQELLKKNSESENKYNVIEPECSPSENREYEMRKAKWVKFYIAAYTANVTPDTLPDIRSCENLQTSGITIP